MYKFLNPIVKNSASDIACKKPILEALQVRIKSVNIIMQHSVPN